MKSKISFFFFTAFALFFNEFGYSQESAIDKYPTRPITYIIALPPGVQADMANRLMAKEAEKHLGQPIVAVNKPGASMTIGTSALASAKPDGYTIGSVGGTSLFFSPILEKVPYHPVKDLRMVMQFGGLTFGIIVKGDSPFKKFKDLIDFARRNPKKLTYGTIGANSAGHVAMEQIAKKEEVEFTHIPFKGTSESQAALMGGHILAAFGDFSYSLVESGDTKLLLLMKEEPSPEYPQVPIFKDLGYSFPDPMIFAVAAPKAVPDRIIRKLDEAFSKAMKEPTFIEGMKKFHYSIAYRNSKDLDSYVVQSYEFFSKLFQGMGLIKK